jgi:threonyl-tRNA synthetase
MAAFGYTHPLSHLSAAAAAAAAASNYVSMQCAHIMAMAVQRLHKDAQVTIGPWIDRGFYYDFDLPTPLSDKELKVRGERGKRGCPLQGSWCWVWACANNLSQQGGNMLF